jgi:hypothetical protein
VDQATRTADVGAAGLSSAHQQLLTSAVGAAVVAPRAEVERWFAWPAQTLIDDLVDQGALSMPARGRLTAHQPPGGD